MKNQLTNHVFQAIAILGLTWTMAASLPTAQASDQDAGDTTSAAVPSTPEAFHAALDQCAAENNLAKPQRGEKPSDANRKIMHDCLVAKGITPPHHGRGHHHMPAADGSSVASPDASGSAN